MNNKIIVAIVLFFLIVGGYLFLTRQTQSPESQEKSPVVSDTTTEGDENASVYVGETPCADCESINITLDLKENNTYTMTSVYRGKSTEPFIEEGTWEIKTGDASNPNAQIYTLTADSGETMNFVMENMSLQQLDENMQPANNPYAMTLTKEQ